MNMTIKAPTGAVFATRLQRDMTKRVGKHELLALVVRLRAAVVAFELPQCLHPTRCLVRHHSTHL
jgi:hypothetical protein